MERLLRDNMNHFDDLSDVVDIPPSGQCIKRVRQPSNDARLVAKRARDSGGGKIPVKACKHDAENGDFCQVEKLSDDEIMFNYTKFYSVADKAVQDQKIMTLMKITSPQRPRVDNARRQRDRAVCVAYHLRSADKPDLMPVCRATFLGVLGMCHYSE